MKFRKWWIKQWLGQGWWSNEKQTHTYTHRQSEFGLQSNYLKTILHDEI